MASRLDYASIAAPAVPAALAAKDITAAEPALDDRDVQEMIVLLTAFLSWRSLRARRDQLKLPLRASECERIAELDRVFAAVDATADERHFLPRLSERHPLCLPVTFHGPGGDVHDGILRNISLSGFYVQTPRKASLGERLTFKFIDEHAGQEWQFVGEVARSGGPDGGLGLRFVGIPLEIHRPRTSAAPRGTARAA